VNGQTHPILHFRRVIKHGNYGEANRGFIPLFV
jgi:hypothetical protein